MFDRSIAGLGSLLARGLAVATLALGALFGAGATASAHTISANISSASVYALTVDNRLISFDPAAPRQLTSNVAISGLKSDEILVGIDFRPANDVLYGVGSSSQLYTIDLGSGKASPVGAPLTPALSGTQFGVDFNPAADRLRIVSDSDQNLRVNVDTGAVLEDGTLRYDPADVNAGKDPSIAAAAYTNPDNDPATGTQLFDIDAALGALVLQNPPNDGVLMTQAQRMVAVGGLVAFDIGSGTQGLVSVQQRSGAASRLFYVDVATLTAKPLGVVGAGERLRGLAITLP